MRFSIMLQRANCIAFMLLAVSSLLIADARAQSGVADEARRAVERAANFIYERSGMELSAEVKKRLATMKQRALNSPTSRITVQELTDILTDIAVARLASLTNEEIEYALGTYRHDPNPKYDDVQFTWDGKYRSSSRAFVADFKAFRERSQQKDEALRRMVRAVIEGRGAGEGVKGRAQIYSQTMPEFSRAMEDGLTPLQAVLIAYSLASDDNINTPTASLKGLMKHLHETVGGNEYPNPQGRFPFGAKGYLFPTPLDLILNEKTIEELLNQMEKKFSER